jgi:NAD(P)-dependent dehydrogenase (short-subunit alcohol dehydrogenase family)
MATEPVALVTGANAGIGLYTALGLAGALGERLWAQSARLVGLAASQG